MTKPLVARKGRPFTIRLTPALEGWIVKEANRVKRHRSEVLEGLLDEAIRIRRFPGIGFRGPGHDRRACLVGTALDVWEVIAAYQAMGKARLLEESDLTARTVDLAIAYYEQYPAEIDDFVAENQRTEEEWHALYPTIVPKPG
jgi:uncharacterized protein (DUF433 family)